jgi:hypothetical protein
MAENTELTTTHAASTASAADGFTFVEDDDTASFYVILPDGEETDWSEDTEIAVFDDGELTYAATNCDDYPGMQPGVVYAIGGGSGSVMPTTIENYADLPDEEEEDEDEGDEADPATDDADDEEEELEAEDPDAE